MKDGAAQIVGKTITGVIVKRAKEAHEKPQGQLFLLFDDNTSYEFYSYDSPIINTAGCDQNTSFSEVYNYMDGKFKVEFHAIKNPDSDQVECKSIYP